MHREIISHLQLETSTLLSLCLANFSLRELALVRLFAKITFTSMRSVKLFFSGYDNGQKRTRAEKQDWENSKGKVMKSRAEVMKSYLKELDLRVKVYRSGVFQSDCALAVDGPFLLDVLRVTQYPFEYYPFLRIFKPRRLITVTYLASAFLPHLAPTPVIPISHNVSDFSPTHQTLGYIAYPISSLVWSSPSPYYPLFDRSDYLHLSALCGHVRIVTSTEGRAVETNACWTKCELKSCSRQRIYVRCVGRSIAVSLDLGCMSGTTRLRTAR
jgi:hypothetical protein